MCISLVKKSSSPLAATSQQDNVGDDLSPSLPGHEATPYQSASAPRVFHHALQRAGRIGLALVLGVTCITTNTGCETTQGAQGVATVLGAAAGAAGGYFIGQRKGRGVEGAIAGGLMGAALSRRYAAGAFKSRQLKFQEAVLKGRTRDANRYVDAKYVNTSIKGHTPIFYAAAQGNTAMVQLLVRNGASLRDRSSGGSLAYVAAAYGYGDTARVLADLGGGTRADVARGSNVYAANREERRRQAQATNAVALAFIGAMMSSSASGGSSGNDSPYSQYDGVQIQNRADAAAGRSLSYPGMGQ
jgi:hypothetical protein